MITYQQFQSPYSVAIDFTGGEQYEGPSLFSHGTEASSKLFCDVKGVAAFAPNDPLGIGCLVTLPLRCSLHFYNSHPKCPRVVARHGVIIACF